MCRQSTRAVVVRYAVAPLIDQRQDPESLTGAPGSGVERRAHCSAEKLDQILRWGLRV